MPMITADEVTARIGDFFTSVADLDPDGSLTEKAITAAEQELTSFIGQRYILPTTPEGTPELLKRHLLITAVYHFLSVLPNARVGEPLQERYNDARRFFVRVRDEEQDLPLSTREELSTTTAASRPVWNFPLRDQWKEKACYGSGYGYPQTLRRWPR